MRLLVVTPEYPPHHGGGIASVYGALLPALVRMGHEVHVLVGSAFTMGGEPHERDGVRVSALEPRRFRRNLERFSHYAAMPELQRHLAAAWAMSEQVDWGHEYDLVEVADWGLLFVSWAIEASAPVVVQMHGSTGQIDFHDPAPNATLQGHLARLLEATLLRAAAGVHTYSTSNAREWEAIAGCPVTCMPPPLRLSERSPAAKRSDRGLVVGRIQKWKGPEVLSEALGILSNAAPNIDWVGRDTVFGETRESMDAHLRATYPDVWGKRISTHDQVAPGRIAELQRRAGFVVVPSLWDVFNLTAVEAMGHGAVVICSNGAGASDLIKDGVNGFSFPADDAVALAAKVETVQALTPQQRMAIGAQARRTVEDALDVDTVASRKIEAYEAAMREGVSKAIPWAEAAARPVTAGAESRLAFLDHQPLKRILAYAAQRALGRPWQAGS